MDKRPVYDFLKRLGVWFEVTEHPAVYNMDEVHQLDLPYPDADAKNLFVRDDKKQNDYLLTVKGDKRVDLKAFCETFHTRPLPFASAEDLQQILGLLPGSVGPLGILNEKGNRVHVYLDQDFLSRPDRRTPKRQHCHGMDEGAESGVSHSEPWQ